MIHILKTLVTLNLKIKTKKAGERTEFSLSFFYQTIELKILTIF